jgi:hypothetical protein
MKKVSPALRLTTSAVVILLSFAVLVNQSATASPQGGSRWVADGVPLPPPIPPKGGTLVADGVPLPPPIPPKGGLRPSGNWCALV